MNDLLMRLFDHMEWANARVLEALRAQPDAESLRLFAHVLGAEETWISRLRQRAARQPVWPTLTLSECADLSAANRAEFKGLLAGLGEEDLGREINYRNSAGFEFHDRLGDILTHVAMHGSYHRGQIARQLRALGATPPYTDYIAFTRRDQVGGTLDAGRAREGLGQRA